LHDFAGVQRSCGCRSVSGTGLGLRPQREGQIMKRILCVLSGLAMAASALVAFAAPASADQGDTIGCNHSVCIHVNGTRTKGYRMFGVYQDGRHPRFGHIDVFNPNDGWRLSSPNRVWGQHDRTPTWTGLGSYRICAEMWSWENDQWISRGLPCVNVPG
jgi:hypothetical protein